LWGDVMMNF